MRAVATAPHAPAVLPGPRRLASPMWRHQRPCRNITIGCGGQCRQPGCPRWGGQWRSAVPRAPFPLGRLPSRRSTLVLSRNSSEHPDGQWAPDGGQAPESDGKDQGGTGAGLAQLDTAPGAVVEEQGSSLGFYLALFSVVLSVGGIFTAVVLFLTADIGFKKAVYKVCKRLLKSVPFRQTLAIVTAMIFVRFGLTPLVRAVRGFFDSRGPWETSNEFYFLREVYKPLELLLAVAACSTLAENILPPLLSVNKNTIAVVVRTILSMVFVLSAARVTFSVKGRIFQEAKWKLELKGDPVSQRRVDAVDKLLSVLTVIVTSVLALNAIGLDINSVLAIGGVGGLAIGLAGREIAENIFNGLVILSSSPFEVGDEVVFQPSSGQRIEGIVLDIGWYHTLIRSFEREIFVIPNSVFSKTVVLNVTRKRREWRFFEHVTIRVQDIDKVEGIVSDMRRIIRQDPRIIQKLHRRVFLNKLSREEIGIYISFYLEAANRDAFMGIRQNLWLGFLDCVKASGARLAEPKAVLELQPSMDRVLSVDQGTEGLIVDGALTEDSEEGAEPSVGSQTAMTGNVLDMPRQGETSFPLGFQ